MLRLALLIFIVMTAGCSKSGPIGAASQVKEAPGSDLNPAAVIYLIPLKSEHITDLSVEDVISMADRKMLIKNSHDSCLIEWRRLASSSFWKGVGGAGGDMRIVFVLEGDTFAFDSVGDDGYVNGRRVTFDATVVAWFRKYLIPLEAN